jgi:hypothetical protein
MHMVLLFHCIYVLIKREKDYRFLAKREREKIRGGDQIFLYCLLLSVTDRPGHKRLTSVCISSFTEHNRMN